MHAGGAVKELGTAGVLVYAVLQDDVLKAVSGDASGDAASDNDLMGLVTDYKEAYITPVILSMTALFCFFHIVQLGKKVRKERALKRKKRPLLRHSNSRGVGVQRPPNQEQSLAPSLNPEATLPDRPCKTALEPEDAEPVVPSLSPAAALPELRCSGALGPEDTEETYLGPLSQQELARASVLLGIEWIDSSAPTASITLTHVAASAVDTRGMIAGIGRLPIESPTAGAAGTDVQHRQRIHEPILIFELGTLRFASFDVDADGADGSGRLDVPAQTNILPGLPNDPACKLVGNADAGASVGTTMKHPEDSGPFFAPPLFLPTDCGSQPNWGGPGPSPQLELGLAGSDIPSSAASGGPAASPSECSGAQVVFPLRPCPYAAELAPCINADSGYDAESLCTEVSAASSGGESESAVRFVPFTPLRPVPTDETDADVNPDGDKRPEWEFVWA